MYLTNHNRPNSTATPVGLRPWRSSKKVSLLEGETGLPPARKTLPTLYVAEMDYKINITLPVAFDRGSTGIVRGIC